MELRDRHVIVTGGASGIGRALARRAAAEGARAVVVADLSQAAAQLVAGEFEQGFAAVCDVGNAEAVAALVDQAEARSGPIDVFFANAGVGVGAGPEDGEEVWDLAWHVNVMHHVYAARALLPGWLARGEGYFVSTASAAGLLSQIGSAPYAVTKHAAVAFSEWMSITYGARGVRVSCLCPQGVNTNMFNATAGGAAADTVRAAGRMLEPDEVAEVVIDAMRAERFLILPHPEVAEYVQRKATDVDRWLAGMRKLQAKVLGN